MKSKVRHSRVAKRTKSSVFMKKLSLAKKQAAQGINKEATPECFEVLTTSNTLLPRAVQDSRMSISSESSLESLIIENDPTPTKCIAEQIFGRRIVDLGYVLKRYQEVVLHSRHCTMGEMQYVGESQKGVASILKFHCDNCSQDLWISTVIPESKNDINDSIVWASASIGIGFKQCEEFLGVLDVPPPVAKTFMRHTASVHKLWDKHLALKMKQAGELEKERAIQKGNLMSDGTPYVRVIVDGGWSKRSYGHGYNALSGLGVIIGAETKKLLFLGIRNKLCSMCQFYDLKNAEPRPHKCFKNYYGPSTGMEYHIITEGFCQSIEQHGLVYKSFVGDGDSNVYAKILETVPYGRYVEKVECANHITRCVSEKLHKVASNTVYPLESRRLLKQKYKSVTQIERIVRTVRIIIKNNEHQAEQLRIDLRNAPYHIFGSHESCRASFCSETTEDKNYVSILKKSGLFQEIQKILEPLILKADRVSYNETTNQAERYMGLVAKFTGGKRINFSKRGSYTTRAKGAALSHFSGPSWHLSPLRNYRRCGVITNKVFERRKLGHVKRRLFIEKASKQLRRKKAVSTGPDTNYGPEATVPDVSHAELLNKSAVFYHSLANACSDEPSQFKIQAETCGQHECQPWREIRRKLLTASNFGAVIKRRKSTHPHNLVKKLLFSTMELNTAAIIYGRTHESTAISLYQTKFNVEVKKCGIFIDFEHPFLGASPDGLVGNNGIVEVKCLPSIKTPKILDGASKTSCFLVVENKIRLKENHNYYYQIQGQLNITRKKFCDFIIYNGVEIETQRIERDEKFWSIHMLPKLRSFYLQSILPELVDSRIARGMRLRDPVADISSDNLVIITSSLSSPTK